jgi:hypothetical protein
MTDQDYTLSSSLTFFIEDQLALTSYGGFAVTRRDAEGASGHRYTTHTTGWILQISLTYYLDRLLEF